MPKPMRVLRVSSRPSDKRPGMGLAAFELTRDPRFVTEFYTWAAALGETHIPLPGAQTLSRTLWFPNPTMPKSRRGFRFLWLQGVRLFAIAWFMVQFFVRARGSRPDVVHIHSPMYAPIAWWGRRRGAATFLTIHGTDFTRVKESPRLRAWLHPLDGILCVSQEQMRHFEVWFPDKRVEFVSNGVDTDFFRNDVTFDAREPLVVAVGTLRWHKDYPTLIEAFACALRDHPQWRLTVLGEGPERDKLQAQIESLGVAEAVRLAGAVGRDELRSWLGRARIYALSSVAEGLPKALLEGMAAGCACIATRVGECASVLGDSGVLVPAGDVDALASALNTCMRDAGHCLRNGEAARAHAAGFSWAAYSDHHHRIYQSILQQRL